jgi:hypothetical protein
MRTYLIMSTVAFDLIATAQLVRLVLGWPVNVAGVNIPLWASAIAVVIIGSLAAAGTRLLLTAKPHVTSG